MFFFEIVAVRDRVKVTLPIRKKRKRKKKKNRTAFWKHLSNYTAILQVKSKFTPFYIKDLFSNHNVFLCATYGEKYNIYLFTHR